MGPWKITCNDHEIVRPVLVGTLAKIPSRKYGQKSKRTFGIKTRRIRIQTQIQLQALRNGDLGKRRRIRNRRRLFSLEFNRKMRKR